MGMQTRRRSNPSLAEAVDLFRAMAGTIAGLYVATRSVMITIIGACAATIVTVFALKGARTDTQETGQVALPVLSGPTKVNASPRSIPDLSKDRTPTRRGLA